MNVERYFFERAFPCTDILLRNGKIDEKTHGDLEKMFYSGEVPNRELLESIYVTAFQRIKRLAKEMNRFFWDEEIIRDYWEKFHNDFVLKSGVSNSSCKLCKYQEALVLEKFLYGGKEFLMVECDGEKRPVNGFLVPNVEVGDSVKVHYGFAYDKDSSIGE